MTPGPWEAGPSWTLTFSRPQFPGLGKGGRKLPPLQGCWVVRSAVQLLSAGCVPGTAGLGAEDPGEEVVQPSSQQLAGIPPSMQCGAAGRPGCAAAMPQTPDSSLRSRQVVPHPHPDLLGLQTREAAHPPVGLLSLPQVAIGGTSGVSHF